ncbi:glycosyltransferase family 2 protein [Cohnella sp. WQ 127256]|uniref:glycosyltransferase family 2 protein n=1 Tax=Cohnella sp. WQ 127256 TaxID=2938790 RepID=UPI002118262E
MNKTSIVILAHNQLQLTHLCLESIRRNTPEPYEIIVVDNGSTDPTYPYLQAQEDVNLVRNETNLGFAKGCNQGWEVSSGDTVLFLNNDTIVTPEWLTRMLRVLNSDEYIGMVGPVTNYASGQQKIPVSYTRLEEADAFASEHVAKHEGQSLEVRRVVGFCMLVKRKVLDEVGVFDERFGLGNYEDDDLCLRVLNSGYKIRVVYDSFVHHFGHMTMGILKDSNLGELLSVNREKAKQKWGRDIHSLIYKEPASFAIVVPIGPLTSVRLLERTISIVGSLANEWVAIDMGATVDTLHAIAEVTSNVVAVDSLATNGDLGNPWTEVKSLTSGTFLFWVNPGEEMSANDLRKLEGLKLLLDESTDAVSMLLHLESDETGHPISTVRRNRLVRRGADFGWNGVVHEFVMGPGSVIKECNVALTIGKYTSL